MGCNTFERALLCFYYNNLNKAEKWPHFKGSRNRMIFSLRAHFLHCCGYLHWNHFIHWVCVPCALPPPRLKLSILSNFFHWAGERHPGPSSTHFVDNFAKVADGLLDGFFLSDGVTQSESISVWYVQNDNVYAIFYHWNV